MRNTHWKVDNRAGWEKVRELALGHLEEMERLERRVLRKGKPGVIHHFRTTSRRLDQSLELLLPAKSARRSQKEVSRARKALSKVRNLDVLIRMAEKAVTETRGTRRKTWEAILEYLVEQRERAYAGGVAKLKASDFRSTARRLRARIEDARGEAESTSLQQTMKREIRRAWAAFDAARAGASEAPRDETAHPLRIAAKRLRYLMEIAQALDAPGTEEGLRALRSLQDQLGAWHDCEIEGQTLTEMAARRGFVRKHLDLAAEALSILAENRRVASKLLRDVAPASQGGSLAPVEALIRGLAPAKRKRPRA